MVVEWAELGEIAVRLLEVIPEDLLELGFAPAFAVRARRPSPTKRSCKVARVRFSNRL